MRILLLAVVALGMAFCAGAEEDMGGEERGSGFELRLDEAAGILGVFLDGREVLVYQFAASFDMPHICPLNTPSGKNLVVQKTEPYPHHRAFYIADTVRLDGGREVSVYNGLYTGGEMAGEGETKGSDFGPPFNDHIRHVEFVRLEAEGSQAVVETKMVWEMDESVPVLDDRRDLALNDLGEGEYIIDLVFSLTAAYGDVEFVSDEVHYAWPFLRLNPEFSAESGGTLEADDGRRGQEATNLKVALWMDYSNTIDGVTEGVAVFQWPDGRDRKWLTRDYGLIGVRRVDERSGKPFTLKRGESIAQRVGILVHKGDARSGRVAERYALYIEGQWR